MMTNEARRFSSACAYDLLAPPRPRIRTWSDSVAETTAAEELVTDLVASERRISSAGSSTEDVSVRRRRRSSARTSCSDRRPSTTGYLATQSLALFLFVPGPHSSDPAVMTHDDLICPQLDDDVNEKQDNESVTSRGSSSRGSSDLNSSGKKKTWRKKLSYNFNGARLKAMALRRNTVATDSVVLSTDKLAAVAAVNRSSLFADISMTIQPPSPASTSSNNSDNGKKSSLDLTALDTDRDYQLKKFSQSTPALPQLQYDLRNLGGSKAWQKKFLRHFTQVSRDERVLNHYSCALVGDLLLQGQLYITYNYYAFYSNVFGYVTRVLIPVSEVRTITKEKTAKIIPNALAICTATEKHVFSSLMSRDVAYKLAWSVWKKFHGANPPDEPDGGEGSSQHSSNESVSQHSVEGIIISPPNNSTFTSVTEGTSSDTEDNDSAISCSPTPEREVDEEEVLAGFSRNELKAAKHPAPSTSFPNLFNLLLSSSNTPGKQHDQSSAEKQSLGKETTGMANKRPPVSKPSCPAKNEDNWSWTHLGIGLLLVTLCISAGLLWYRIYLLHSHLELRLSSSSFIDDQLKPVVHSLYPPQMQELVDNLHVLLSSRTSNEDRKNFAPAR